MGCCASTLDDANNSNPNPNQNSLEKTHDQFSSDEETVKQVLSETPKLEPEPESRPRSKPKPNPESKPEINGSAKNTILDRKWPTLLHKLHYLDQQLIPEVEIISQVSELCSLSDAISTTTLDEQQQMRYKPQGQNGQSTRKINNHNDFCNDIVNHRNVQLRNHGRSPVRRAGPSPPRRYSSPGTGRVGPGLARRSRSPAARPNVGRGPSVMRNWPSPGRVSMGLETEEDEWAGLEESLENPLVSMECFIFL